MDTYIVALIIIGAAALGMTWMPAITQKTNVSYSVIYVILGVILYGLIEQLPFPDPLWEKDFTLHFTELIVIISLMGTGLKIDQRFSFKTWAIPFRLVTVTMLLSILAVTFLGWWALHLDLPAALLLGAALAPTDPVLASDVQVGPPHEGHRDNIRFTLTSEAGLNDGMAFPFTWLAIGLALSGNATEGLFSTWLFRDLIYKILSGAVSGFLMGNGIAWLIFRLPEKHKLFKTTDGFVAISITLLVYGAAELIAGYGFIAVFVAAVTIRNYEMDHSYHQHLHDFIDQIERLFVAVMLILFGGSIITGLFSGLTWQTAMFSMAFVIFIRPATAWLSLINTSLHLKEKMAISFFGIKGIGSFFYLAFALQQAYFTSDDALWAVVGLVVLLSVVIHGFTATYIMKKIGGQFTVKSKRE